MDLLEFVEQQVKKGKSVQEVRELLVNNGYPLYEVDNALAVAEEHVESKGNAGAGLFGGIKKIPGYAIVFAISGLLIVAGIATIAVYFLG